MATVYRARDIRLNREVAVKVIHRHLRENQEVAARFAAEALAVAKVKHRNVVEVYDVSGTNDPERYLVVELVRGKTLRQLLSERGHLPAEVAAAVTLQICAGLAHAHRQGVVHRDIKPENVLVQFDVHAAERGLEGERVEPAVVKLTDFGIAKLLDAQGVTSTGQVLGSPAHMAPEQIEGGPVDARSDVFGVGVLLYECLVGSLPFDGNNPAQVLRRVLEGTFTPADRARPTVGSLMAQVVGKALAQSPDERYRSVPELAEALEALLSELGFDDPEEELSQYLVGPDRYTEVHARRLLTRLADAGHRARASGDIPRAASHFNRALAFKPDDTQLLAEVAGLARRARARRRVLRIGVVAVGVGALGGLAAWLALDERRAVAERAARAQDEPAAVSPTPSTAPASPSNPVVEARLDPEPASSKPSGPEVKEAAVRVSRPKPRLVHTTPPASAPEGTRQVRTPVVGPQNAKVRIDGKLHSWFRQHELTLGPHTFEFVPPNEECCVATPPTTVEIVAGDGPQVVRGTIPFQAARIQLTGPPGTRASCGTAGQLGVGESRDVPMAEATRSLRCTVFAPPGSPQDPKQIDVTLQPGRTFTVTGP